MSIVTWNMQGASHSTENKWNSGVLNLLNNGADLCCLQECGGIPASAVLSVAGYGGVIGLDLYTWGTSRAQKHILFYPADPGGNRCNLAIVSKVAPTAGFLFIPAFAPIWRPTIGMTIGGTIFFTLHAISPNGPDAPALVNGAFGAGANVIVAGDYNRAPETMGGGAQVVCPPNGPTHPATHPVSYYDYAIKNFGAATLGTVLGLHLSDHLPVLFS
jgi:cytolethal distending toxin subunit B